jgi:hypothetical protein
MSTNGDDDGGPGEREVAHRLFAAEFEDAEFEYSESDEDRAPNYVVTPTGARVNRMFVAGVLTEVETVNEDTLRGRVVDPTGAFVTYAGQYQPDEMAFLDRTTPPAFVSLTGKARTFQPEDSDLVYTSVRPESLNEVDAATRDRWVVTAAEATLYRVAVTAEALSMDERGEDLRERLVAAGVDHSLAAGVPLAIEHYGTTEAYLEAVRTMAVQALEIIADERDEIDASTPNPDADDGTALGVLPDDVGLETDAVEAETAAEPETAAESETAAEPGTAAEPETAAESETTTPETTESAAATTEAPSADSGQSAAPATEGTETETTAEAPPTESTATDTTTPDAAPDAASDDTEPATTTPTETQATETTSETPPTEATGSETDASESTTDATETEPTTAESGGDDLGSFDTGSDETAAASEPEDTTDGDLGSFDDGGLGSFEDDTAGAETTPEDTTTEADTATETESGGGDDFDPEDFDEDDLDDALTEEEREAVMAEHEVTFSSGTEVPEPEESDLDAPDPEEIAEAEAEAGESPGESVTGDVAETTDDGVDAAEQTADATEETASETTADEATADTFEDPSADDTSDDDYPDAEEIDLQGAVVGIMDELNDGDGADREKVLALAVDRYGAAPDTVEDAIQEALMSGQCYEAGGGLKPI